VGRETDGEMPQLQLPIFPADVTAINQQVAVSCESGKVVYVHGVAASIGFHPIRAPIC
jgi:hypothetical protein